MNQIREEVCTRAPRQSGEGHRAVRVVADSAELALAGAAVLAATIHAAAPSDEIVVGLAGGSTPRAMYEVLASPASDGAGVPSAPPLPWPRIRILFGDERCVGPDHLDSNYRMAREALLDPLGVPPDRVHRMKGELGPADGVRDYDHVLAGLCRRDLDGLPVIDLLYLGMGDDGHTASLFPGTPAVRETVRLVTAGYNARLDSHRITMTPRLINGARLVVFLVAGASKADVLRRVLEEPGPADDLPSRVVRPTHGSVLWLVDRAAASRLAPSTIGG